MMTSSKKEILNVIKRHGSISIDDTVAQTELAKSTVREHLKQLELDGYLTKEYVRSGPGRPSLHYQLTGKGHKIFPTYESELLREWLRYLKEEGKEQMIEHFFQYFWKKRTDKAEQYMDFEGEKSMKERLQALQKLLEEEGFMPEFTVDENSGDLTVKECNCPFREVVKETRLPCKLEAMFYEKLFNTDVERKTYIADGDYSCTYDINL